MSATSKETAAIWPGYVAAIASLVLSLLLLLAILVFAMTQVGNMVSKYTEQLMRAVLEQEAALKEASNTNDGAPKVKVVKQEIRKIASPPPGIPLKQIRFVFEARLAAIPATQTSEVSTAIRDLQAPADAHWLISAATPPNDPTTERSTYRLMLAVRRTLVESGVAEQLVELRIHRDAITPDRTLKAGVIAITLAPLHALTPDRKKP